MAVKKRYRKTSVYLIGEDFTKDEYDKWYAQIAMWIAETQPRTENPREKAKAVLDAAINGHRLNGEPWTNVEDFDLAARIMSFCSWDIITGTGRKRVTNKATKKKTAATKAGLNHNTRVFSDISLAEMSAAKEAFKGTVYIEFPFLDNPIYEANVNALADSTVRLESLSEDFLVASGSKLKDLLEIRDSLKKDIDAFMKLLKIHPSQLKEKVDEGDKGDVGTLVNTWEAYGDLAKMYEAVDAVQEAIQIIRQLENVRVDGSPQLADWMLWHKTGCRGHKFICSCEKEWDLHGGFTKEEMYAIAEQAYKTFGFGLKRVEDAAKNKDNIREDAGATT